VLKATALIGRAPVEVYALVAGHGELWSARLLAAALAGRVTLPTGSMRAMP
jgi:bifunctional aspartokinase / homoserine dehydrogenase 1